MNRTGEINPTDASFFGVNEMSKAVDFPSAFIKQFILRSASSFGLVKQWATGTSIRRVISFKMVYDQASNGIIIENDSLAIDSQCNLIVCSAGTPADIADSYKDGNTYKVYVSYRYTNEEQGLVKLFSVDGKTAEMSWDVSGAEPVFFETLRGGTKYPTKILFTKKDGTSLQNVGTFTVISVDKTNNKAIVVGDIGTFTENKLSYSVIGTHEPSLQKTTADLYKYDSVKFSLGATPPSSNHYLIGEVKFTANRWQVVKTTEDILGVLSFFSMNNVQPYDFDQSDFTMIGNKIYSLNTLRVRTDIATADIVSDTNGSKRDVSFDENTLKICVAPNTWKKIDLTSL